MVDWADSELVHVAHDEDQWVAAGALGELGVIEQAIEGLERRLAVALGFRRNVRRRQGMR